MAAGKLPPVPTLVAIDATGGPAFVSAVQRAWDDGDAVLPVDPRLPPPARERLLEALGAGLPVAAGDALVMATSGTTGDPKGVVLTHDAVGASALATSERLGVDPAVDHWLACLPLGHVGGMSVVTRALVTGTPRTATVTTTEQTRALVIAAPAFRTLLRNTPSMQLKVLDALANRLPPETG